MLDFAISIARQAGALLLDGLKQQRSITLKGPFDLVTDVDLASEALLVEAITRQFPDHSIYAEEGGGVERASAYAWVIDPLDGTNNYAHGFPFFSVSIALLQHGQPIIGVVYDPLREELFSAVQGQGAHCNQQPISVSDNSALAASLVSTGFPYDYGMLTENNLREFDRVHRRVQGIRRAGSAALDLAYVAAGRLDAHWELHLKPWDSAAGALLVREAGGKLSNWQGAPWNPWSRDLVASNGRIHYELIGVLNETA